MDGERSKKTGPIDLDWGALLGDDGDMNGEDEPPHLVLVSESRRSSSSAVLVMDLDEDNSSPNELQHLPDKSLFETLERMRKNFAIMSKLKDGGDKFRRSIKKHEDELRRRQLLRSQKNVDDGFAMSQLQNHNGPGVSDDVLHLASSAPSPAESTFASCFRNKLEGKTGSTTGTAFENEFSVLNSCNSLKMSDKQLNSHGKKKRRLSLRESPFRSPGDLSLNVYDKPLLSSYQKEKSPAARSPHLLEENMSGSFRSRNATTRGQSVDRLNCTMGEKVVLLVDEEDLEVGETTPRENELHKRLRRNTSIFYPSRDAPGSIEICYSDLDCLAAEAYLSSTIMNFYIRYLEEELTVKTTVEKRYNFHFFNTYFYEKLKEAVSKKNNKEDSFSKFRRWWKGVNIFEKAYIFLPIHENLHWSLVIVCIPDKDDRSGPILLHLDSLGLHSSSSIFINIRSFLKEEWKFLREEGVPLDLPFAETIWENLPRRFVEQRIEVPQQRNEYDCGLFVLFFMKRFIEEAPGRLKRKDLEMFGKHWFSPTEASNLRRTIRNLLKLKFKNANNEEKNQVGDL